MKHCDGQKKTRREGRKKGRGKSLPRRLPPSHSESSLKEGGLMESVCRCLAKGEDRKKREEISEST